MTADDVCGFLDHMEALGIHVWLDGGWAVDACLGSQSRRHADLDIVIEEAQVSAAVDALRSQRYQDVPGDDARPWNFVLGDDAEHRIDFHVIAIDGYGRGVYGPPASGEFYPADALAGTGLINGRIVACVTAEWLVKVHTGYELRAKDWSDVAALCERFGIQVPAEYQRLGQPEASSRDERQVKS
jgi:lincosamide nucleotidyltransferase A/C/D/E